MVLYFFFIAKACRTKMLTTATVTPLAQASLVNATLLYVVTLAEEANENMNAWEGDDKRLFPIFCSLFVRKINDFVMLFSPSKQNEWDGVRESYGF